MPTHSDNIAAIRRRLGMPLADAPSDPMLMQLLIDQVANFTASLANTRNHWRVDKTLLTVNEGQEDYLIGAGDFGRPFLVHTVDETDTYHVRREIPIVLMQDADHRYVGAQQSGMVASHSAVEAIFYRQYENWYVRFVPIPGGNASYQIWYETVYDYGSPGDNVGLNAFHHLLRVQTAISALPHCAWRDVSLQSNAKGWETKVRALRDSLAYDEQKFDKEFRSYKAQSSREGVSSKLGYASDFDLPLGGGTLTSGWGW